MKLFFCNAYYNIIIKNIRRIFKVLKKINFLIEKLPMVMNRQFTEEETHENHSVSLVIKERSNSKIGF